MELTKSEYRRGFQCPKKLWMDRNKKQEQYHGKTDEEIKAIEEDSGYWADIGNKVGIKVQEHFNAPPEIKHGSRARMVEETKERLKTNDSVVAEATFEYNGCFCRVDILNKTDEGYEIIEAKSSTDEIRDSSNDDESGEVKPKKKTIKPVDLADISFQYYVVKNSGLQVSEVMLMRLNKRYIKGKSDEKELFAFTKWIDEVSSEDMQKNVEETIEQLNCILAVIQSRCQRNILAIVVIIANIRVIVSKIW